MYLLIFLFIYYLFIIDVRDNLKQKYIIISFHSSCPSLLSHSLLTTQQLPFWPITQLCELTLQLSTQVTQPTCRKVVSAIQHLEI